MAKKNFKISGFSRFEKNDKKYNKFLEKTKKEDIYITLKDTKKIQIFLEIQEKDVKKIKNTVAYIFYVNNKELNFKITEVTFVKETTKQEILKEKKEINNEILLKIDRIEYSLAPEDILELTKAKFI